MAAIPATTADLDDVKSILVIIGAATAAISAISLIVSIIVLVFVHRLLKKLRDTTLTIATTRMDVRKTLEAVENSVSRNPMISMPPSVIVEDKNDGLVVLSNSTEPASPIFTRRTFSPPLTSNSLSDEALDLHRNRFGPRPHNLTGLSQPRAQKLRPAAPVRRTQSFYEQDEAADSFY